MDVRHVQDGELPLGIEPEQILLANGLARRRLWQSLPQAGDRRGCNSDLKEMPPGQHGPNAPPVGRSTTQC